MRYSLGFKETQVKKVLPPQSRPIASVAREAGISDQTLRNWLAQAKDGTLEKQDTVGGAGRSSREKFNLVIESKSVSENDQGKWLREKGLHSEHITLYEQELRDLVEDKGQTEKEEIKRLKKENKRLEKELSKKEKALAEMAALYTLKKKAEELWGDDEDD
ncbi:transposase [Spirochaeta isovalerica]|uniref:Transposase-like protein n=1 Tax=Spirochaeta isovalerica TaxID=150 RepID=A0A841RHA2_9SPIO|nr:transposase [Spirochaeta isovalerica]MBB6482751.1 transposase-like protein [Spirochaeta isovalerica]